MRAFLNGEKPEKAKFLKIDDLELTGILHRRCADGGSHFLARRRLWYINHLLKGSILFVFLNV